jgi:hypothetical protein
MGKARKYTKEEKYQAAVTYLITGSQRQTATLLGFPQKTVNHWVRHNDEEFNEVYQKAIDENLKQYDARVTSLIEKSLKVLEAKLDDPDSISAKDATVIHSMLFDKRQLARSLPTSIQKKDTSDLERLAANFAKIAESNAPKVIEGETIVKQIEKDTDDAS